MFEDLSNENVIHIKNKNIEYLQFKRLLEYKDKLVHCYTLRPLDYNKKHKEDENYIKICNALNLDNKNVVMPIQTHTNVVKVANFDSKSSDFQDVDGLVTDTKNKVLSAVFADCNAILLYDPIKNVIGNIHSGWKGTVNKIGKNAVDTMVESFGSNPQDIICCIGPSIRQCHFEVEEDVKNLFIESFNDESIIKLGDIKDGKQRYYIDSVTAIINTLKSCGLKAENIVDSKICTFCNSKILHSHRAEKGNAGRNCSIMCLV